MDIQKTLADFKREIDREIEIYFNRVIKESQPKDQFITQSLRYVKKLILSGGKRLRPALMYYGYLGAGGKEKEKILKTSVSIELIHMFLLIHDDIIDRDARRHGMGTVNARYAQIGRELFGVKNPEHFGDSMALIIGDMISALGNQIIFESDFNPRLIMKALSKLQSIVSLTVIGQSKDIYMEYQGQATEEEVLAMYEYKTARYTVEGPLQLGAILGGAEKRILDEISQLAVPLGIAFQIQDDILGIFGSEDKLGKAVGSDIKEGKQTLLLVKAMKQGNKKQKEVLASLLGKQRVASSDINNFRQVIEKTGSLDYARNLAHKLIGESQKKIAQIELNQEAKLFLSGVADYMLEREM